MVTNYYKIRYNDPIEDMPRIREIINTNHYIGLIGRLAAQALEITTDDAVYIAFQPKTKKNTEEQQIFRFEESLDESGFDWKIIELDDILIEKETNPLKESILSKLRKTINYQNQR